MDRSLLVIEIAYKCNN